MVSLTTAHVAMTTKSMMEVPQLVQVAHQLAARAEKATERARAVAAHRLVPAALQPAARAEKATERARVVQAPVQMEAARGMRPLATMYAAFERQAR